MIYKGEIQDSKTISGLFVECKGACRYYRHIENSLAAQLHDRTFSELTFDLSHCSFYGLFSVHLNAHY